MLSAGSKRQAQCQGMQGNSGKGQRILLIVSGAARARARFYPCAACRYVKACGFIVCTSWRAPGNSIGLAICSPDRRPETPEEVRLVISLFVVLPSDASVFQNGHR
ncbi:hypothetical protein XHV734_0584 [Xanthomonas hortorum pv. vitians]|nr:hypothetical protein XHV734_0584 [Xanthomonas hortorum pv. vitians]